MIKKSLFYGLGILAVIGGLTGLYRYLTTGSLTVTSNDLHATISISQPGKTASLKQGVKLLSAHLHTGIYTVVVKGNSNGISQTVNIAAHKSSHLQLNPAQPIGVEPITDLAATNLAASSTNLYFINKLNQNLYQIDQQNNISPLDTNVSLQTISWISANEGVGQDSGGRLYKISGGHLTALKTPSSANLINAAPNGDIYYSNGQTIYVGRFGSAFAKFYSADKPFSAIAAASTGLAVINSPSAELASQSSPYITFVSKSGHATTKKLSVQGSFVWSPDGQHLAVAGSQIYQILDQSLRVIANLPNSSISNPMWRNNNELLYTVKDQLWTYGLSNSRSTLLANMPLGDLILSGSVSQAGDYAYLAVSDQAGQSIKRVPLSGQASPDYVFVLQNSLPENVGECSADFVNFSGTEIMIRSSAEEASPSTDCTQTIKNDLVQKGVDVSKLSFTTI